MDPNIDEAEMNEILAQESMTAVNPEDLARELVMVEMNAIEVQSRISQATAALQTELSTWQEQSNRLREMITAAMTASVENGGSTTYEDDFIKLTYVKPSVRQGVDMDKMKLLEPEIFEKYRKETKVKSSVRIRVK